MDEEKPILELESVGAASGAEHDQGLASLSLALRRGERLLILLDPFERPGLFGDLASGLVEPDAGRVVFDGHDWARLGPARAAAARARIGRVYERPLWVSNLDVDENITLVQRHFTTRPEPEIDAEAVALARSFGLEDLPRLRPARVPPRDLRVADWTRAFLGRRDLLILERPLRDAPPDKAAGLVRAARAASDRGAAVIWLQDAGDRNIVKEFEPARVFEWAGAQWAPVERN
ncbi:MAG TPA: ABC transporter ATP-binding protein [Kiritimatiellia bacterium]|nr:ABC transporter ATP-binding protein [Kiritimatiellia bacterium]HRZ13224.1 ABC transporter ATP-binding protein [Kiritimatiellia bacterium]HSA18673.1 ABC transporter ATP-binding protein [Kiritimatiellia bacterium]